MSILDKIAADQAAVASAQAALDAANAQLSQDQATLANVQPILAKLDELEQFIKTNAESLYEQAKMFLEEARSLF